MIQEKILWSEKPSKKFILYYSFLYFNTSSVRGIGPIGLTFLILFWIFGFFYLLVDTKVRESAGWGGLIAMGVILALFVILLVIYNIFLRKSYQYTITNNSVKITGGVFIKIAKDVPFSKITDVNISQNILEKIIGIYELHIQTAGSRSFTEPKPEISFLALNDPNTPKNLILQYVQQVKSRYSE